MPLHEEVGSSFGHPYDEAIAALIENEKVNMSDSRPKCAARVNAFGVVLRNPCDEMDATFGFCLSSLAGFDRYQCAPENCHHHEYLASALPTNNSLTSAEFPPLHPASPILPSNPMDLRGAHERKLVRAALPHGTFALISISVEDGAVAHARKTACADEDFEALKARRATLIAEHMMTRATDAELSIEQRRKLETTFMAAYFTERRKIGERAI